MFSLNVHVCPCTCSPSCVCSSTCYICSWMYSLLYSPLTWCSCPYPHHLLPISREACINNATGIDEAPTNSGELASEKLFFNHKYYSFYSANTKVYKSFIKVKKDSEKYKRIQNPWFSILSVLIPLNPTFAPESLFPRIPAPAFPPDSSGFIAFLCCFLFSLAAENGPNKENIGFGSEMRAFIRTMD